MVPDTTVRLRFDVRCPAGTLVRPYPATLDPANEALRQRLIDQTGNLY